MAFSGGEKEDENETGIGILLNALLRYYVYIFMHAWRACIFSENPENAFWNLENRFSSALFLL